MTKATKSAMTKALGLLEELTGSKVAATSGVRSAVAELITAGNLETLQERHPHLTELVRQLFDWAPGTDPRATEEVVRAAENLLHAEDDAGRSLYHQAVSMLSYAAAAAPLIDAHHLVELIETAYETEQIYAPIRYTATLAVPLQQLIGHYPIETRAMLISTLWEVAHEGRWWTETLRPTRTYRQGEGGTPTDTDGALPTRSEVMDLLLKGELVYTPLAGAQLSAVETLTPRELGTVLRFMEANKKKEPDYPVLVSYLRPVPLERRPESPIPMIVSALKESIGEQTPAETFPADPERFADICPRGSYEFFGANHLIMALDGEPLEGVEGSRVEVLRHETAFVRAAEFCDFWYSERRIVELTAGEALAMMVHSPDPKGGTSHVLVILSQVNGVWKVSEMWAREKAGVRHTDPRVEAWVNYVVQTVVNKRRGIPKPQV